MGCAILQSMRLRPWVWLIAAPAAFLMTTALATFCLLGSKALLVVSSFSGVFVLFLFTFIPMLHRCMIRMKPFPHGHCQNCNYDLRGRVSAVCSECGYSVEASLAA